MKFCSRSFLHAQDVMDACLHALSSPPTAAEDQLCDTLLPRARARAPPFLLGMERHRPATPIADAQPNIFRTVSLRTTIGAIRSHPQERTVEAGLSAALEEPLLPRADPVDHAPADAVFFASSESTFADVFVSFVMAAPRWLKFLSLAMHVNLGAASSAALLLALAGAGAASAWREAASLDAHPLALRAFIVLAPLIVFIAILLFGHHLPGRATERVWLATRCLHQSRTNLRARALTALPEFIGASERLLVLLAPSHFHRLWPLTEASLFCAAAKAGGGSGGRPPTAGGAVAPTAEEKGATTAVMAAKATTATVSTSAAAASAAAAGVPRPAACTDGVDLVMLSSAPWLLANLMLEAVACVLAPWLLPLVAPVAESHVFRQLGRTDLALAFAGAASHAGCALMARLPLICLNSLGLHARLAEIEAHTTALRSLSLSRAECANPTDRTMLLTHLAALAPLVTPPHPPHSRRKYCPPRLPSATPTDGDGDDDDDSSGDSSGGGSLGAAGDGDGGAVGRQNRRVARALSPWLQVSLGPSMDARLSYCTRIGLGTAQLVALAQLLDALALASAAPCHACSCLGDGAVSGGPSTAAHALTRVALGLGTAALAAPLPLPVALRLLDGATRALRGCCCCAYGRGALHVIELPVALVTTTAAYALGSALAALPTAYVHLTDHPATAAPSPATASAALGVISTALAALAALHALLWAPTQPRCALALMTLAAALATAVASQGLVGTWPCV